MKVEYDGAEYTLDLDEIDVVEASYIKVKTGLTLLGLQAGLEQADPDALKALFWLMHKQSGKAVDIERVNFKIMKFIEAIKGSQDKEPDSEAPVNPTKPASPNGS